MSVAPGYVGGARPAVPGFSSATSAAENPGCVENLGSGMSGGGASGMIGAVVGPDIRVDVDAPRRAARSIATRLAAAIRRDGHATVAVSGGSTAPPMLSALAQAKLAWDRIEVWQVDERVAPDGHPDRNANQLAVLSGRHHLMPVTARDLRRAANRYGRTLPARFDVIHLGMGPDGHTASWPPGDPVIDSRLPVDLSAEYHGRIRMTLTPGVVNRARGRVVLITGADKATAVASWLAGADDRRPIARLRTADTVVVLDPAAASRLRIA
jgi:6-phosphogluconolactonase/glucosamine-6-phosphate isomerase/deaminase